MDDVHYTFFQTPVGDCAVVWAGGNLLGVQLPEAARSATRARVRARFPGALDAPAAGQVAAVIRGIQGVLAGRSASLEQAPLELVGLPAFHRRVYEAARRIPAGTTQTYGELARSIGAPGAARAVGQALSRNPFPLIVPCHRVVAAGGRLGGFTAAGGLATKQRLLALERAPCGAAPGELPFDVERAVARLAQADLRLARTLEAVGPCLLRVKHTASVFQALAEAIVHQQLSIKAAGTIWQRLCVLGGGAEAPSPTAVSALPLGELRAAGLSHAKSLALQDLAKKTLGDELPTLAEMAGLTDEAIVERLTVVRGVGRWTAEMFLILRLGRPDVLPLDDLGVRKGYSLVFGKPEPSRAELLQRGTRWAPYRSVASWYLWRALEL